MSTIAPIDSVLLFVSYPQMLCIGRGIKNNNVFSTSKTLSGVATGVSLTFFVKPLREMWSNVLTFYVTYANN